MQGCEDCEGCEDKDCEDENCEGEAMTMAARAGEAMEGKGEAMEGCEDCEGEAMEACDDVVARAGRLAARAAGSAGCSGDLLRRTAERLDERQNRKMESRNPVTPWQRPTKMCWFPHEPRIQRLFLPVISRAHAWA